MNAASEYSSQLNEVAVKVREFRLKRGLTQQELAEISQVDRKTVNRIENASYSITLTTLFALADALEVKPSDLVD